MVEPKKKRIASEDAGMLLMSAAIGGLALVLIIPGFPLWGSILLFIILLTAACCV